MSVREIITAIEGQMQKTMEKVRGEFSTLRTGRASAAILENIRVDYYGALTPINQLANVAAPEARTILTALGHPQLATVITCDNKCAVGLANDTLKIKRSKSIDMRFHWIRDRIRQGHFVVVWAPGADNRADFFTKALPTHAHQAHMPSLVVTPPSPFRRAPHPAHVRH